MLSEKWLPHPIKNIAQLLKVHMTLGQCKLQPFISSNAPNNQYVFYQQNLCNCTHRNPGEGFITFFHLILSLHISLIIQVYSSCMCNIALGGTQKFEEFNNSVIKYTKGITWNSNEASPSSIIKVILLWRS